MNVTICASNTFDLFGLMALQSDLKLTLGRKTLPDAAFKAEVALSDALTK